jgi:hypothetical protein
VDTHLTMLETILVAVPLALAVLVLARSLPAQNIAFILGCLIAWEIALQTVWGELASLRPGWLFWPMLVVWARIVVRWILRLRRKNWNYGFLLILLAGAGTAALQFACAAVSATRSVALEVAAIRLGSTVVCLLFLTPWFISKLPQQPHHHAQ